MKRTMVVIRCKHPRTGAEGFAVRIRGVRYWHATLAAAMLFPHLGVRID